MMMDINEGNRPSRLSLDRYATDELSGADRQVVADFLVEHAAAQAHLEAIEIARTEIAAFDASALRARAATLIDEVPANPAPANRPAAHWLAPVLLLAALVLVALVPMLQPEPSAYTTIRSSEHLKVYQLEENQLHPYEGNALGNGDILGFKVATAGHRTVVLLSVDGNGAVSVFYPENGVDPLPLNGNGIMALPGSVILDSAPGPEIFFAVFDTPVADARDEAARAWQAGGMEGLSDWIDNDADVAGVAVERE